MSNNKLTLAKNELWRRGVLVWKLDEAQKQLYKKFYGDDGRIHTWLLSRRNGKTYLLIVLALEQCIKKKNSIVKIIAPTKLQINNIIRPIIRQLLEDCPEDIKPQIKKSDFIYYFSNGSELQLAGTDGGHAEKLRGGNSDLCLVDEAGSCDDLNNIIRDILLPTTLLTKGKIILASTPPKEPDHEFLGFIEECEMRGTLTIKTIYDNPRITPELIEEMAKELGGKDTDSFKRECLCQIIKSEKDSVFPEVDDELLKEIVMEWDKPPFYDAYESMDLGFKDLTVVLLGYYDFRKDKVIIEDEVVMNGSKLTLPRLIEDIRNKENALWFNPLTNETKKPYLRISDINYIVTQEIYRINKEKYGDEMSFSCAKKDDNAAAINTLRVMLATKKIIIHPRCTTLIRHLKNCRWLNTTTKDKFARSPDDGHYDAADALKYFVRHIIYTKNPYPYNYGLNAKDLFVVDSEKTRNQAKNITTNVNVFKTIFNIKGR